MSLRETFYENETNTSTFSVKQALFIYISVIKTYISHFWVKIQFKAEADFRIKSHPTEKKLYNL